MKVSKWHLFFQNKRAKWSFYLLCLFSFVSIFAEFIANDKPLLIFYRGHCYAPVLFNYVEKDFNGQFETAPNYHSNYFNNLIHQKNGWMIWPPIRYSFSTHDFKLNQPAPSPPSRVHLLGTDDRARDVLANLIYGFRVSLYFGTVLTVLCAVVGVYIGAIQGYFGGHIDLWGQRFIEIWTGLPTLYILIILSSLFRPGFWILLFVMFLFGWPNLVAIVRASFLKGRCLDYVIAAKTIGLSDHQIMFKHILPNAMAPILTLLPFMMTENIAALTALDFLGFGLPPGSASLGALLAQSKSNLYAPWIGISVFFTLSIMMSMLVFIGEGIRDAFDPRLDRAC